MTAKKTPQLKLPGVPTLNATGVSFAAYERGVDAYDRLRAGGEVDLVLDDGAKHTAVVQTVQVGPLIDLLCGYGSQAVQVVGRVYTPLALVQALTEAGPDDVLDVTKLYTVVVVNLPIPAQT